MRKIIFLAASLVASVAIPNTGTRDELSKGKDSGATVPKNSICEYGGSGIVKTQKPSGAPNYFFRTFNRGGKEYVSYANANGGLAIMDMKTGKESKFMGDYDPVPLNEDIMSTPPQYQAMTFYSTKDILSGRSRPAPISPKNESPLLGVYQSVGQLPNKNGKKVYRMITDSEGATSAEYAVKGRSMEMTKPPARICGNIDFKLPMLSKNGTMMSGYDIRTNTTKIWSINDDGNCTEIADLGVGVGKADFSYDNEKVTFHTSSAPKDNEYFSNASSEMNMNVFVYDLKNKSLKKMSQNKATNNSYYPVFRPDNTIIYSQINKGERPLFVQADPKKVSGVGFDPALVKNNKALTIIGAIWGRNCLGENISATTAVTTAVTMNPDTCKKFVNEIWDDYKVYFAQDPDLSKEKLLNACPTGTSGSMQAVAGETVKEDTVADAHAPAGQKLIAAKCSICHQHLSAASMRAQPISKDLADKMMKRINGDGVAQMPPGGGVSAQEREMIRTYISGIKSQ